MSNLTLNTLRPGDTAPVSGVYVVIHSQECQASHTVTVLAGEILPSCSTCSEAVRFQPTISALHVREHPRFTRYS